MGPLDMPCHVEEKGTGWPCQPTFGRCVESVDRRVVTFSGTTLNCVSETRQNTWNTVFSSALEKLLRRESATFIGPFFLSRRRVSAIAVTKLAAQFTATVRRRQAIQHLGSFSYVARPCCWCGLKTRSMYIYIQYIHPCLATLDPSRELMIHALS